MNIVLFSSRANDTEHRYLALSTHTLLRIEPDFVIPEMIGQTFGSVLDAYQSAVKMVTCSKETRVRIMDQLIGYRMAQDIYYRSAIGSILETENSLPVYDCENLFWGGCIRSDGLLIGENFVGKLMMKHYFT